MNINKKVKTSKTKSTETILKDILGHVTFGEMLKSLRLGNEMTQVEFAQKLKISKQDLCVIEGCRKVVSVERALKFAKSLKESPEVFASYILQDEIYKAKLKLKVIAA